MSLKVKLQDNEPGIDTLIWVAGGSGVPKALTDRKTGSALLRIPYGISRWDKVAQVEGRVHKTESKL